MRRVIKLLGLLAFAGLTACSWFKDVKNPPAALVEFKQGVAIKKVWTASIGAADDFVFAPVAVDNSIFAAAANGKIYRFDAATGHEIWRVEAELPLTAGVGADATTLAVVGSKGVLYAYDLNGKLRWQVRASSEILASPVVGGGLVVVRSLDNHVAAYDIADGKRRWVVERTLPPLILRSAAGMTIAENLVFAGMPGGKLVAITLSSGSVKWEATVGEPKGATELERVADVSGVPAVYGADICASAFQGQVACFDLKSGVKRWSKSFSTDAGVSVDERFVFAASDKGTLNAFSRSAGLSVWKNEKLAYRRLSAPVSFAQTVAVGDLNGYIHFLSREDGSFLARVSTDGSAILATPMVVGANVVFQTKSGEIVALAID